MSTDYVSVPNYFHRPKGNNLPFEWCFKVYAPVKGQYREHYDTYLRNDERKNNYTPFVGIGRTCSSGGEERKQHRWNTDNPHRNLLNDHQILSRKDWKEWMLKNHPDKNLQTDVELVARINTAMEMIYPSKRA